jgi:hypothetical protein
MVHHEHGVETGRLARARRRDPPNNCAGGVFG